MSFIVTMVAVRQRAVCAAGALVLAFLAACSTPLPDPQSAGGQVYQVRCSSSRAELLESARDRRAARRCVLGCGASARAGHLAVSGAAVMRGAAAC